MRAVVVAVMFMAGITAAFGQANAKKRVAVLDFDTAAATQGGVDFFMFQSSSGPNLGKVVADLLITRLVQDGSASVIERAALDKLVAEQNFTNSDRTDPLTAAKLGRLLGVDAIILGSITNYVFEDQTKGGGPRLGGFGGYSTSTKHDYRALVQISARVVSPDTAEVLFVAQGANEINRKNVKVDIREMGRNPLTGQGSGNPMMHEAMDKAVSQLSGELEKTFPRLPPRNTVIDGVVADANATGRLVLNVGAQHGVKVGDRLQVWHAGKEIRDPVTNRLLMRDDSLLGEAVVTTVNDISSIAEYRGTEKVQVGDLVKSPGKN